MLQGGKVDVAFLTVQFLYRYLTERHEFEGRWALLAYGFRNVVEARVGHRITTAHTTPRTPGAKDFERRLRKLIADDPEFGTQLWMTLKDRLEYAIYLDDREQLFDHKLLDLDAAYEPPVRHWWQLIAVVLVVLLVICGSVTFAKFLF
jgi:hypothetical protein